MPAKSPVYVPALRLKRGEYRGLARLAPDVADRIVPRLVVPPPKDRDPEMRRLLTKDEIIHLTGHRIGKHWLLRPALLEPRFLFSEFGEAESGEWLPRMFEAARRTGANPIPVATLSDMIGERGAAFLLTLDQSAKTRIALRVESDEIDSDLAGKVAVAMSRFGIAPEHCALLLDFAGTDFSNVETVAAFLEAALESVQAIGLWQTIAFQGTNYPERNPAKENSTFTVARNEWLAWSAAVHADAGASDRLIFGDYCADNAKFDFGRGGGGAPIRHYRYCTSIEWLIARGKTDASYEVAMREVSQAILASGKFAGRDFSSADEYIFGTASGRDGPGNASTWREINTAHHITQVISDIGKLKGFRVARQFVEDPPEQLSLLSDKA